MRTKMASSRATTTRTRMRSPLFALAVLTSTLLLVGCGGGAPPPTPVVIVVTATPAPVTAGPATKPSGAPATVAAPSGSPAAAASPRAAAAAASPALPVAPASAAAGPPVAAASPTPAAEQLTIGRTNAYRGLLFTVDEARTGQAVEGQTARRGKTLVGVRLHVENAGDTDVQFANSPLNGLMHLRVPDGGSPAAEANDPFVRPVLKPHQTLAGWAYFELDRPAPLAPMALLLGSSQETQATVPFSGPAPAISKRTFEYLRSTEPVRGLIWSVSGGELRLDIPGQQANPGQEFIVVKIRATNPSTSTIAMRGAGSRVQRGTDYLRVRADNGVLLQVSAELSPLPTEFPAKAEQDTLYAWQLPLGSRNPKLVILSPDGSEHELELGPLPPP